MYINSNETKLILKSLGEFKNKRDRVDTVRALTRRLVARLQHFSHIRTLLAPVASGSRSYSKQASSSTRAKPESLLRSCKSHAVKGNEIPKDLNTDCAVCFLQNSLYML